MNRTPAIINRSTEGKCVKLLRPNGLNRLPAGNCLQQVQLAALRGFTAAALVPGAGVPRSWTSAPPAVEDTGTGRKTRRRGWMYFFQVFHPLRRECLY